MKFWTTLPGLSRWPPASFAVSGENWQEHLAAADFQRIAAAADRLGFDSVSVPEHVVLLRALAAATGSPPREPDFEIAMHAVPTLIGPDHRLQAGAAPPASTQQVIDLIAELDTVGVTWTNVPPLAAGPRSLAGHLEYLEWAATEVIPAFR